MGSPATALISRRYSVSYNYEQRPWCGLTDFPNDALGMVSPPRMWTVTILKVIDAPPKQEGGLIVGRQDKFSKAHLILYACGIIPVV